MAKLTENLPEGAVCTGCGQGLDDEERVSPRLDCTGDPICDDCYQDEYQYCCCNCGEHYDQDDQDGQDVQHKMIVVFVPTAGSYSDKVQPGIYRITGKPYWSTDYFSSQLFHDKLKWLCKLPVSLQEDDPFYPVAHLCRDCQAEMIMRGVRELTRKCAMAF